MQYIVYYILMCMMCAHLNFEYMVHVELRTLLLYIK